MNKDWIELLESLDAHKVDYVVIGAWAMAFHGQPRYTGDLDLLYRPSETNAEALLTALQAFGVPTSHLTVQELSLTGMTITYGNPPNRVDLLNWLSGLTYEEAVIDSCLGKFGDKEVRFLSIRALSANKRATGRTKDIVDLEILSKVTNTDLE